MLDRCLPRVVGGRDEQRVPRVGQDEGEQLVGRRRACGEHDAVGVKARLAAPYLLHEARHRLQANDAVSTLQLPRYYNPRRRRASRAEHSRA
jgi:hypothetical protein